jgi:serine/threonine protein kinase
MKPCPRCGSPTDPKTGLCPRCLAAGARATPEVVVTSGPPRPASPPLPSIEELAPHFPGFEIEALVGQGGMGAVWRARHKGLERVVALKVLHADVARDPGFSERFSREARTLAALSHEGIVAVHDVGQAGPHFYLVMEFVDGVDLRALVRGRELAPREALGIVIQICEALQYAHDQGIVHRDIKPENILIDTRGRVKVLDFGLAKLLGAAAPANLTRSHQVMGTPHYMAPEQWERPLAVDHRADIFSLGVVFYELLTGELPVGRFAPPSQRVAVDVRLDEVVLRALEREPERRYQQASEVRKDVARIEGGRAEPSRPAPRPRARRGGNLPLVLVLVSIGALYAFLALVFLFRFARGLF